MIYVQYSNATNLKGLLEGLYPYLTIDPEEFYFEFFNIDTCNAQGLDNYGRMLNQSRFIQSVESGSYYQKLGFRQVGYTPPPNEYPQNFNNGNFYGGSTNPQFIELDDADYRVLLKFKYLNYTSNFSYESANRIMNLYALSRAPNYKAAVIPTPGKVMDITFQFNWELEDFETSIFQIRNVLPVALGVAYRLQENVIL